MTITYKPGVFAIKPKICFVVSAPETAETFLRPHILNLRDSFEIDVIANCESRATNDPHLIHVPIIRRINPTGDVVSWFKLRKILRRGNYDIVHSVTPKAGLLTMTAAFSLRIPHRLHWFTGQVWATRGGILRWMLRLADKVTFCFATEVLVDSHSQLAFLEANKVVTSQRAKVLANGSISGVDTKRFRPSATVSKKVRQELEIPSEEVVILYVGRLTREKGLTDLVEALAAMTTTPPIRLVLAGSDEEGLASSLIGRLKHLSIAADYVGYTQAPEELMAAADIFCMPSHREGFGLSVIEAAACGVPCIATRIYGLSDAVKDGETGLLFTAGNILELEDCINRLVADSSYRGTLGQRARNRVIDEFSQGVLTSALKDEYFALLGTIPEN